jgi:hypothetical protein
VQGDGGAEAGSSIITKHVFTNDLEYTSLVDKYKPADAPDQHRLIKKVRRAQLRTSSDELGGDGNEDPLSSAVPHHPGNTTAYDSDSDLDLESDLDDEEGREKRLKEKRAMWESTLPKTTTQLDGKPMTKSEYTFIESDETPTKTYEQRHYERKKHLKNKSRLRQKMPFS